MTSSARNAGGRVRDLRLDFFRGLAMFIILVAHIPENPWTLWIPARFGFSDATEIFVFCSGMASAYAFGSVFTTRGLWLGTMRVVFRVWQVYWAHVGVFLVSATILVAIDLNGWGAGDLRYVTRPFVVPFFEQSGETLIGLLTLSYVPGLFDILPMYLVILALIPLVMAMHRVGGTAAVASLVGALWLLAALAGHPRIMEGADPWLSPPLMALAEQLSFLNLPALPGHDAVWFFNPFAWQLIFFTGFAFGMGWLPTPPVSRRLATAAVACLLLSTLFAWVHLLQPWALEPGTALQAVQHSFGTVREAIAPLTSKTWFGALRYLHFLALGYLAWLAVGPRGVRLSTDIALPETPAGRRRRVVTISAVLFLLTVPYGQARSIAAYMPGLDAWVLEHWLLLPDGRFGLAQLLNYGVTVALVWNLMGAQARGWVRGPGWAMAVRVIGKVGTQSLAVFMTSIPLAILCGWALDWIGRAPVAVTLVNLSGFAILVFTAYFCSWIKGHPWRRPVSSPSRQPNTAPTPAE